MIADLHGQCADLLACDPALIPGEHRLLGMFADLRALSRPDRGDQEPGSELVQSPQEHLHAWLRSLDAEAEGLPPVQSGLRRALAHYGIESLERTPALEEACYRLFLSQQRAESPARRSSRSSTAGSRRPISSSALCREFREALDRLALPSRAATRSSPTSRVRSASATSTSR